MAKSRIYLLNTGNILRENVECAHDSSISINYAGDLKKEIERESANLDPRITPGQMLNVLSIETSQGGRIRFETGNVDYVEHVSHARAVYAKRELIDSRFNPFCAESVNITKDGLIVALRRGKYLPHGPGIYTCAGGYGVHFRGRKDAGGRFIPLNLADPYDVISLYLGKELKIPEDSFNMSWLGASKCYDLSFDLPINFLTQLTHSSDDLRKIRQEELRKEKGASKDIVIDDLMNFIEDTPEGIISFFNLIGVQKDKLPKDSVGTRFGENSHTGTLGINDDFIAALLQYLQRRYPGDYDFAISTLDRKGYNVIPIDFKEGTKIMLEDLKP